MEHQAANNDMTDIERENEHLRHEIDMLTKAGVIEVAVRNPSVAEYMRHWEDRAEKAETERDALNEIIGMCAAALPNGAFILPQASLDLKRKLPKEITLCIEKAYAQAKDSRE